MSIQGKQEDLRDIIKMENPDILLIQKMKLKDKESLEKVKIMEDLHRNNNWINRNLKWNNDSLEGTQVPLAQLSRKPTLDSNKTAQ